MAKYWKDTILNDLVELLKRGDLYVFAGAGVSCLAGFPSWQDLLEMFASAYRMLPNKDRNIENELAILVAKCDTAIIDLLLGLGTEGQKKYGEVLTTVLKKHSCDPVHEWLIELPFAGYITTNYDLCFEEACRKKGLRVDLAGNRRFCYPRNQFDHSPTPADVTDLSAGGGPFLLHMHGCPEYDGKYDIENIILTNAQYAKFYNRDDMECIYDKCFYANVLVLGTSLNDPYFMNKLREKRGPGSTTNLANRKTCYVIRPEREKSESPHSDKQQLDFEYDYFQDMQGGLRNMIGELWQKYTTEVRGMKSAGPGSNGI